MPFFFRIRIHQGSSGSEPVFFYAQEEAGYFYPDMVQANGDADILFFPSSYRRAIKYGQRDAANEILRTEVLTRLGKAAPVSVVTYPDALAEKVVSRQ